MSVFVKKKKNSESPIVRINRNKTFFGYEITREHITIAALCAIPMTNKYIFGFSLIKISHFLLDV